MDINVRIFIYSLYIRFCDSRFYYYRLWNVHLFHLLLVFSVTQYCPTPNDSMDYSMPKYWSFSFSISPSNEYSGLISFRITWLDLLAVQGTLKNLLQHHSSKASIFGTQLSSQSNSHSSHSVTTLTPTYIHDPGKSIALTKWTFVGKVMSLLFNMLSRLVITFLPRSKHLLISC